MSTPDWESAARKAGVPQEQIDQWRQKAPEAADKARRAAGDPENQQAAADAATRVTWWAFFGTLLSMLASVAGACVGAGPRFRIVRVPYVRTRSEPANRQAVGAGH